MHWTPGKCPQLRLQTCTAHFHSTQLDCLSHLTWLVKSYPSLLMGNMEGQKTKYNGPTHPNFFPSEQQILNSEMTRQSRLKRVPKTEAVQSCWSEGEKLVYVCMSGLRIIYWQSYKEEKREEKNIQLKGPLEGFFAVAAGVVKPHGPCNLATYEKLKRARGKCPIIKANCFSKTFSHEFMLKF